MDDLDLIRSLRADPRAVDLEGRDRSRARLERHAAGRRSWRRRPPRLVVLGAAMALFLAGAVTLAVLNAGTARPKELNRSAASPVELLGQAASAARAAPPEPALTTGYWYSRVDRLEARGGPYRHDLRFREERWVDLRGRGRLRRQLQSARFPTARDRRAHDRQGAPFTRRPYGVEDTGRRPAIVGAGGWYLGDNLIDLRGLRRLPADPAALEGRLRQLSGEDGDLLAEVTRILADAPLQPALRASMYEVLRSLDGLRLAERPAGLGRFPAGTAFIGGRAGRDGSVDTVVAIDPRAGRVLAQVSVLVTSRGRGRLGDFRSGDRIGEYRWGPAGVAASTADRP